MDVHTNNWRYFHHGCDVMAHLVIPEDLIEGLYAEDRPKIFSCTLKVIDYQTNLVSEPVIVWARSIDHRHTVGTLTSGIALSIPLLLTNDTWHPFNIILLRFAETANHNACYVRFFYQTIFSGLIKAGAPPVEEVNHPPVELPPREDPLVNILQGRSGRQFPATEESTNDHTASQKLVIGEAASAYLNHRALERSPSLRGALAGEIFSSSGASNLSGSVPPANRQARRTALVNLVGTKDFTKDMLRLLPLTHCLSGKRFWLCMYNPEGYKNLVSCLNHLSEDELKKINPLSIIQQDTSFLTLKMNQFVDSLLEECRAANFRMQQVLGVAIRSDASNALEYVQEQFYEACFTLRCATNENSGWVKAAVATQSRKQGVWLDVISLWDQGVGSWGVSLKLPNPLPGLHTLACIQQLSCQLEGKHKYLLESVCAKDDQIAVLHSHTLNAWLLLPGGFAIKGKFTHSEKDLLHISSRYGV
ncbi:ORF32 [Alcelaphine gammaherpesvirus 1]|uniref:Capsid vertex component 1 n=1 Tax=Alcelaphine herpesvirus 1 (strain C500) TaxID=654901 RepID=CVC1_ALHV1|nr:ORF32 [Alcelaphine gammaherpesvirus 1]O36381.1 RecName: Full=Capsid vertex component 1 [Alcelaphine herpesvirus 1 strain C500]AAC58078.1 ORF32 [Alcelaphine gammaherpesvirus 1]APB09456.1 DNA packaging tegument protein UL17 [Alcelaphine gammaherpesvirus 1]APB09528.1 DNA packaging tegument protein UL17 [Alcelaphine gammaherpesvirus 1]ATI21918.1 ORF32 [Alcelaphine gammaherpesvirus 1]QDY92264.1 DNA packaging tegument protein UL17 [Alcelaphine gammaherpesvirus 1]